MPTKFLGGLDVRGDFTATTPPSSDNSTKIATTAFVKAQGYLTGSHTHTIANITGLQTALDGKQAAGSYAAAVHGHTITDVTGLQAALDGKQAAGSYAAASHTHTIANITGLQTALDGKQPVGSYLTDIPEEYLTQPEADALYQPVGSYAAASHTHSISNITGLQSALDGKALVSHTHAISDVSGLQSALDGKASTSHNHDSAYWRKSTLETQNPVGTTYGSGQASVPPYYIGQNTGDNDGWKIYGEAPATNQVRMVFEVNDDIEGGNVWTFRNKKTYGDFAATEPFIIDGSGNITATGGITASGYNKSNWDTAYGWGNHASAGYLTSGSLSGYATRAFVNDAVSAVVSSAPETLDTLRELATALGDDPNFATTITNLIAGKANASHTHTISQITGLQTALDGKAATSHEHTWTSILGRPTQLSAFSNDLGNYGGWITASHLNDYTNGAYRVIADYGGNTTWYLRSDGQFIWGNAHDWTQSFRLNLAHNGTENGTWAYFGQQDSNASNGRYRGVRIRKYAGGAVDGDLSAGAYYIGDTRKDTNWDAAYSWGNHAGLYAASSHTHTISQVTGLQTALDGKQAAGSYAASSHTHSIDSITDEHRLFNNMGENHGTRTEFDAEGTTPSINFGWRYVQGSGNGPNVGDTGNGQYYGLYVGLGNDYSSSQYGMQIAIPRLSSNPYLSLRFAEGGSFGAWQKISAAYADSAGSVAWANVTGKPSTFAPSSHTHSISDVSGLQSALDGKQAAGSYLTSLGFSYGTGVSANYVVQRDANGYIYANHINFSSPETENPSINSFFVSNGDGWSRKATMAHVKSQLGLGSAAYASTGSFVASNGSSWSPHPSSSRDAAWNTFHTDYGYIQFGPANPSWAHIYSDKNFYFNQDIYVNNAKLATESYVTSRGYITSVPAQSWSSITNKPADWLNTTNLVQYHAPGNQAVPSGFYEDYNGNGNPTGTWFNYVNVRHSNPDNGHGFQAGMSYYDNNFWFRSYQGGLNPSFQNWAYAISSQNIGSQSVNYANSAGAVAWDNVTGKPSTFTPSSHSHSIGEVSGLQSALDAKQNASTAITTSNIGSQSVNYANSAGSVSNFSGTINGDVTWAAGANIRIDGESSFDLTSGGQWGVWESQTSSWWLRANWGDHLRLVENGKNVYVYGSRLYNDSGQQAVFNNGGTWGINISGNASTASTASNSDALGGLGVGSFLRDDGWNGYPGQDANTQGEMRVDFTYSNNAPFTGELIRFGASGYSTQFNTSYGNSDNFAFRTRNGDNSSWNAWRTIIHSANIGSQSVNYASSAGNADTIDGYHLNQSVSVNASPTFQEVYANGWFRTTGNQGLYNPTNNAHFRPNPHSYGAWSMIGSRNGWKGIEFEEGGVGNVSLMVQNDSNTSGFHNNSYGWQIKWYNGTMYIGKNSYGGNEAVVLDSSNYTSYAAASSHTHTWGQITDRPTALSQFTNNTGFITGSGFAYPRRSDGTEMYFRWDGQGGQPTWLWGSEDGVNQYVYNPSNFSVNYANSAGSASSASTAGYATSAGSASSATSATSATTAVNLSGSNVYTTGNNLYIQNSGANHYRIHHNGGTGVFDVKDSYQTREIGTIWPAQRIVWGDWMSYFWLDVDPWGDNWGIGGNPTSWKSVNRGSLLTFGFSDWSDRRHKSAIVEIENAVDKVCSISGYTYWKRGSEVREGGVIAQDVLAVFPEAVDGGEEGYAIKPSALIGLLMKAVKEQQEQINILQQEIEILKTK